MEEKKISLYLLLSFILNFCLTFTIIWTLGILLYLNIRLDDMQSACPRCPDCAMAAKADKPAAKTPRSVDIEVTDNGFANNAFQFSANEDITVVIRNTGVNPHSFVIDSLGLNSGIVEAGNFRVVAAGSFPDKSETYTFYSDAPGDEIGVFSGVFQVSDSTPAE